jgi:hypothetical protein
LCRDARQPSGTPFLRQACDMLSLAWNLMRSLLLRLPGFEMRVVDDAYHVAERVAHFAS